MISISLKGIPEFQKFVKEFTVKKQEALIKVFTIAGIKLEGDIKQSVSLSARTGIGPRGGKLYEPSSAGEPPRLRTGNLRASIGYEVSKPMLGKEITLKIGAIRGGGEVKYAEALELGTSKMSARPFLQPMVNKYMHELTERIKNIFKTK